MFLSEKLELNLDFSKLKHFKKSVREVDYKIYYNEHSKKIVEDIFSSELEKFNYRF